MVNSSSAAYTIYFPPGTYKITHTVTIGPKEGGAMLGHGASTTLLWGGESSNTSVMVLSVGTPRWRFAGLVWDGAGKAGIGLDHNSSGPHKL